MIFNRLVHMEQHHGRQLPFWLPTFRSLKFLYRCDDRGGPTVWDEKRRLLHPMTAPSTSVFRGGTVGPVLNMTVTTLLDTAFQRAAAWTQGTMIIQAKSATVVPNLIDQADGLGPARLNGSSGPQLDLKVESSIFITTTLTHSGIDLSSAFFTSAGDWGSKGMRIHVGGRLVASNANTTNAGGNASNIKVAVTSAMELSFVAYFNEQLPTTIHRQIAAAVSRGSSFG